MKTGMLEINIGLQEMNTGMLEINSGILEMSTRIKVFFVLYGNYQTSNHYIKQNDFKLII